MRNLHYLKKIALLLIAAMLVVVEVSHALAGGRVHVRGYTRKDGTYVAPHYRTAPDKNPYNNYSYPGNYNPNKGEITGGDPEKYLERYYNRERKGSSSSISPQTNEKSVSEQHETALPTPIPLDEPSSRNTLPVPYQTRIGPKTLHPLDTSLPIPSSDKSSKDRGLQDLFGNNSASSIKQKGETLNDLFK